MKKIFFCILTALVAVGVANAKKMSDLKIYINPGHGGYTSNDRPINLEIFPPNDTLGYWESKSNLYKGLHFYHILDSLGAKPYLSRIKNTEADDRNLNDISAEANKLGVDLFFSIHSNAGEATNFPLMLYREQTRNVPRYPENVTLSNIHWDNLYSSKLPIWTRTTPYVCGDINFYWNSWKTGLGVLRQLYVVGLLSEGSNHEHRPEAYRLLNDDYCWLEAWHFVKTIMEFYDTEDRFVTGNVAGIVYDDHNLREKDLKVKFTAHDRDKNATVNGAYIELLDKTGKLVQKRTTDNLYNGVYVFRNVTPGDYTLRVSHDEYYTEEKNVTVTACNVTYQDFPMVMKRPGNLEIQNFTPADNTNDVSCSGIIEWDFNYDVDQESLKNGFSITPAVEGSLRYSNSYKHLQFVPDISFDKTTTYTVKFDKSVKSADTKNSDPTLGKDIVFTFTTRDYDKIELLGTYPAENGTVDYRKPSLEFRFDSQLTTTGLASKIVVKDENGNVLPYNTRSNTFNKLTNGFGNAIMVLKDDLVPGKKYTVDLDEMIRNKENLPLGIAKTISFTAVDNGAEKDGDMLEDFEGTSALFTGDEENSVGMKGKPTYTRSTADKLFGKSAAKLTYNFINYRDGEAFWTYNNPNEEQVLVNNGDKLIVHVNGDFNNHELYLGLTGGGDTKYFKVCDMDFKGWRYYEVPVEGLLDGVPYYMCGVKLTQVESPITQSGVFGIDNIYLQANPSGVEDIIADSANGVTITTEGTTVNVSADCQVIVSLYDMLGRLVKRTNETSFTAPEGQYVVKVQALDNIVAKRISLN